MKVVALLIAAGLVLSAAASAEPTANANNRAPEGGLLDLLNLTGHGTNKAPELDPKRIINKSNSFLKEREPEMTAEEFALYEKVESLLVTNPQLAVTMLETMMADPEAPSPAFEFILGNAYYSAGQLDHAEQRYRSTVKRFPTFLRAWDNLGLLYYTGNRFAEAAEAFSKAVALGDRDQTTLGILGYCLEREGDSVSAEMAYLQAVTAGPTNADWKEGLLRIYVDHRQYGRAEPLARALIKAKPMETRYWVELARIYVAQGRKTDAMVVLEEAASAGAAGPDEFLLLGDLYAEQNLAGPAIAAYGKVPAASRTRSADRLLILARVLVRVGRLEDAQHVLDATKTDASGPQQIALLQTRADLLMARKQWPEARQQIEALLALSPLHGPALLALGRSYLEEQNTERASLAFETASRVPASAAQAHLELANLELRGRHYAKAAAHLEKALTFEKNDAVTDALARVRAMMPRDTD